ncbi:MAG TPA: ABC transporter ATP-binding protein [Dictyoglomaceae bacterium]|nr:ABC transporter ATP-binding protein [Dictyoglomaceae bacterium]HOL39226.1 ABC transporter ATP-binding protein [Dictyoglomaceae bacterium]HPP15915.1 ABC transporter ATP-binding protein [Dictyoglomaceae bacterium]HPU43128.1 ABC transporter ATP-binding protein [Dictyoglomaceae bacterium]
MEDTLILGINNVKAYYAKGDQYVKAVDGVSLDIYKGEVVGIVGESGCGKSTLSNVMIMNIRRPLTFVDGNITLNVGANFLELNKMERQELQKIVWGRETSIIPQSAMNALMPTKKIRDLISDLVKDHFERALDENEIIERAKQRFRDIGVSPDYIYRYPFELSGGMRQRAVIAVATLLNPRLLIADEPTSALDVATQKMVLKTFERLRKMEIVESVVFITHDIATVRQIATRMVVMYAGKIVENSPIEDIIKEPLHPYTKGLLLSVVTPEPEVKKRGLSNIPGTPPDLANPPQGCRFYPRCSSRMPICEEEEPVLKKINGDREVACFLFNK